MKEKSSEQNKTWQLLLDVESQRRFSFSSICHKPIARLKSSTHLPDQRAHKRGVAEEGYVRLDLDKTYF